jgi:hypothetical protein
MAVLDMLWTGAGYFFSLLGYWASIFFIIPFENAEIFWILIPVWINFLIADFYQEKRGTGLGNAISNGAAMLLVGVDWVRYLVRNIPEQFSWILFIKFALGVIVAIFGLLIIIEGAKGKQVIQKIARIRQTSYVMLVLSPIIYGAAELTWKYLGAIIIFFPLFYWIFEIIDRILPDPKSIAKKEEGGLGLDTGLNTPTDFTGMNDSLNFNSPNFKFK